MRITEIFRIILLAMLLACLVLAIVYRDYIDEEALQQFVDDSGSAGPLVFILIYTAGTILFLPGSVLTLAGGAIFGPVWGTFYNLTAATIGAGISFQLARHFASDWVSRKSGVMVNNMVDGVNHEGWRFVAFVRLVPFFPFNFLNYALGVTRIKFWHYLLASYIFMMPGAVAYTYLGHAAKTAVVGDGGLQQKTNIILFSVAILAFVAYLPKLIYMFRKGQVLSIMDLKSRLDSGESICVLDVRSNEEFSGQLGHIENAMNIPLTELAYRTDELDDWYEEPVAIICHADKRAQKAAQILTRLGYADVHTVKGGMKAWNRHNLPIV